MKTERNEKQSRREFFRACGRYAALGMLGGFVGRAMTGRKTGADKSAETCVNEGVCRGCPRLNTCKLPAALSAREAVADK